MGFNYLSNVPLEEARAEFLTSLEKAGLKAETETINTVDGNHRITAKAVYAHICAPHYNACAMDGIALDASLTFGATDTRPVTLTPDQFKWVNTGDPLPEGCDAVVMVEDVIEQSDQTISSTAPLFHGAYSPDWRGYCRGRYDRAKFAELTPAVPGAMLAAGVLEVEVIKKPLVGIIPPE